MDSADGLSYVAGRPLNSTYVDSADKNVLSCQRVTTQLRLGALHCSAGHPDNVPVESKLPVRTFQRPHSGIETGTSQPEFLRFASARILIDMIGRSLSLTLLCLAIPSSARADYDLFERRVRSWLAGHCFECHRLVRASPAPTAEEASGGAEAKNCCGRGFRYCTCS